MFDAEDTPVTTAPFICFRDSGLLLSVSGSGSSVTSAWAVASVVEAVMLTVRITVMVVMVVETVVVMMMVTMIATMLVVMVMVDITTMVVVAAVVAFAARTATAAATGSVTLVSDFSDCSGGCTFAVVFWGRVVDWHCTRNGDEGKEPDDEKFCHFVLKQDGRGKMVKTYPRMPRILFGFIRKY